MGRHDTARQGWTAQQSAGATERRAHRRWIAGAALAVLAWTGICAQLSSMSEASVNREVCLHRTCSPAQARLTR
jgi:hypothetical protein